MDKINKDSINALNKWKTGTKPSGLFRCPSQGTIKTYNTSLQNAFNLSFPKRLPQWIKYDKNVLKFYGYFCENVVESAYENYRIRKCNIFYYLDDDTIHISEVHEENSGIVQGDLIKRQRCFKSGKKNEFISWHDLNLQSELLLYGKKFRICDCDNFTKFFYANNGYTLNQPEKIPEIHSEDKFKNVDYEEYKKNIAETKEYIEVGLKGGHPNKSLKQFLENDRKVLNFEISWFDDKYDKEEKIYKMNYYLADGKIEIREIKVNNSGKDPFPLLLRKMKLPKKPQFAYCPGLLKTEDEYYTPKDLFLGNYVFVFGRPCHLVDCDEFTRKWYKENFGVDMNPVKVKRNPPQRVIHPIPPHIGLGSEEDSLLSVFYLNPSGKIHEYYTDNFKRDKHILRFNAKLISPVPSDEERMFIVSFYARDESIQIFEVADRNSGRLSCKFLERKKMKNPFTKKYYTEKDLVVGNTIYLNKYTFRLLECDEYTKKYMRDNAEIFRDSDCSEVIERIKTAGKKYENFEIFLITILKILDPDNKGYITSEEIREGLKKLNVYLSTQELISLTEKLGKNEEGKYSMENLYNLLVCYK